MSTTTTLPVIWSCPRCHMAIHMTWPKEHAGHGHWRIRADRLGIHLHIRQCPP